MTNDEILNIYKTAANTSHLSGLRAVWNAGWYEKAGITPSADSADQSGVGRAKPVAVVTKTKK